MWRALIIGVGLIFLTGNVIATGQQSMLDPLFGILYDPQQVQFESAPARVTQLCPKFHGRKLWVYAHFRDARGDLFVVSGFVKDYTEGPVKKPVKPIPDYGAAIALHANECQSDPLDWFWSGETNPKNISPIKVTSAELNGLAADAIKRYVKAFGGPENFRAAIESRQYPLDPYKEVTRHLRQFLKNPSAFSEKNTDVASQTPDESPQSRSASRGQVLLTKGKVITHTRQQSKRRDTCIFVTVRSADGFFPIASATNKDCTGSDVTEYEPGSIHSFDLKVENGITKEIANGYKVSMEQESFSGDRPDSWTFDVTVVLYFSDGSKLSASKENVSIQGGPPLSFFSLKD